MEQINFTSVISHLIDTKHHYGPTTQQPLTVVGGTCPADVLLDFLNAWPLPQDDMPFCLWEEVSSIALEQKHLPRQPLLLERGRIFGRAGDLTLRRDGTLFRWWFIGLPGVSPPTGYGTVHNFWADAANKELVLHRHEDTALLWGLWDGHGDGQAFWHEPRVARARLHYPGVPTQAERVQVRFWSFTSAGQVMFVWLCALEAHHG
jgi:hypothetical protein